MDIRTEGAMRRCKDDIDDRCATVDNPDDLFQQVSDRLRRVVPFDGSLWFGTDPATMLATRPARMENIEDGHCETFWQREFFVEDTNLFVDLARLERPTMTLYDATGDRPTRSARYREFLVPQGYDDELRALLRVGRTTWGALSLYRAKGRAVFTRDEVQLVNAVSLSLGAALRKHLVRQVRHSPGLPDGPGIMVYNRHTRLVSANAEAQAWLDQLDGPVSDVDGKPVPVFTLLWSARAVAEGREPGPARLRLLTRTGSWVLMHASAMGDLTVVVIERANANEVAPMIVEAYDLSPREQQVTALLARGCNTTQMAQELHLSTHTVRDYVKSVFEKVGVGSRGELVALLFATYHAPEVHEAGAHASA